MENKITVEDFRVIIRILMAAYPRDTFIPDEYTFNLWYTALQDIDYPTLNRAASSYVMSKGFPPSIADIRQLAYNLKAPADDIAAEEWSNLMKALGYSGCPEAYEHWERLPDTTKQIVGSFREFQEWGNTATVDLMSVQRPMFIKRFEETCRVNRQRGAVPTNLVPPSKQLTSETVARLEDHVGNPATGRSEAPQDMLANLRARLGGIK